MPGIRYSRYEPPPGSGMAPPNTKAKSTTNMIDWSTAKIASSGMRGTRLRLRHVITRPSSTARPEAGGGHQRRPFPAGSASSSSRASSAACPVRVRNTSSSVGRRRPMSSIARPSSSRVRMVSTSCAAPPVAANVMRRVCSSTDARAVRRQQLRGLLERGAVVQDDLDALAADLRLELVGGAAGDDLAAVDDGDLVGELVGLLEVLRRQQERRALPHLVADDVPHAQAAARVEAGGRLVEEQQLRAADERAGEVEPPPHAAGVRLGDPVGGVLQAEALEHVVRPPPRLRPVEPVEPAEHPQVLAAGEVLVDGGVLPREADDATHGLRVAQHVDAGDAAVPASGRSSVARMRTVVVLPAPFGPSRPSTVPVCDVEVDAVERAHLALAPAVDLDQSLCLDRCHAAPDCAAGSSRRATLGGPRRRRGTDNRNIEARCMCGIGQTAEGPRRGRRGPSACAPQADAPSAAIRGRVSRHLEGVAETCPYAARPHR